MYLVCNHNTDNTNITKGSLSIQSCVLPQNHRGLHLISCDNYTMVAYGTDEEGRVFYRNVSPAEAQLVLEMTWMKVILEKIGFPTQRTMELLYKSSVGATT